MVIDIRNEQVVSTNEMTNTGPLKVTGHLANN